LRGGGRVALRWRCPGLMSMMDEILPLVRLALLQPLA
jgi:hypothetical protein